MRNLHLVSCGIAVLALAPGATGQAPVIQSGGVQNAASNVSLTSTSPQMLVTIKGQNLATSTEAASGFPWPVTLGGASVTFNGKPATLFYASPTQIDAQVPSGLNALAHSNALPEIVVSTAAGSSASYPLPQVNSGLDLGIFTQDTSGCGQAVAYNVHSDGTTALNTPQNSLDPGRDAGLTVFLTGLGYFPDRMDGVPWTFNPSDMEPDSSYATAFGLPGLTNQAYTLGPQYIGPAPGKVGIDQINLLGQWTGTPQGCHVPMFLYLNNGLGASQLVDVSIQSGGGACSDPPDGTLGIVAWQQTTVSDTGGVSTSAAIVPQFIQSNGLGFSPPPPVWGAWGPPLVNGGLGVGVEIEGGGLAPAPPVACNASLPTTLAAGDLTLTGPGLGPLTLTPTVENGRTTYRTTPPGNAIQGGEYQVTGLGGSQVGAFTANGGIPAPIAVTTSLQPGSKFTVGSNLSYNFAWTGGTNESIVWIQVVIGGTTEVLTSAYGAAGSISIWGEIYGYCNPGAIFCEGPIPPGQTIEVIITQTPALAPSLPFSAPGLGMGGELTWTYVFDFKGLTS
jgi:uncharacterized protein (TIGR03437 family)